MAIKIKSTKDVTTNGIKCVLYGFSGSGKTVMGATAPKPLFISAEKGLLSISDKDIDYLEVATIAEIGQAYEYAKKSSYETIIIDSLSEITELVLDETKKTMIKESSSGKIDARQAYGKIVEIMGAFIRNFRDIDGKNIVFIAKEIKYTDDDSGVTTFEPYMPGRMLPFNLPYLVDLVINLQMDRKGDRFVQTKADRKKACKDRSGKLDDKEIPNFTYIFNKIKGKKG